MKNSLIKYCHGWAQTAQFWDDFLEYAPLHKVKNVDLGFMGAEAHQSCEQSVQNAGESDYMIAHSLGGLVALNASNKPKKGVIIINGFTDFMAFTSPAIIDKMRAGIQNKPALQIKQFLKQAALKAPDAPLQTDRLLEGLDILAHHNMADQAASYPVPILVLLGGQDNICPLPAVQPQWQSHTCIIHPTAGHALPQSHPQWCVKKIQEWIDAGHKSQ